jgi:thermostable 8-oxoguanine DNA glycosylase
MQEVLHLSGCHLHRRVLPAPDACVFEALQWGRFDELLTPAYWAAQSWMWELEEPDHYRLGSCVKEELLACLLGGYGIPAEVGLAAYRRLKPLVGTTHLTDFEYVRSALAEPLIVNGRSVRYRFVNQKAKFIAAAFAHLADEIEQLDDRPFRDALMSLPGVGPKTASWIVRNIRGSDQVAILDIHILRICRMLGIFPEQWRVETRYRDLEDRFLTFATAIDARASVLDSVMWMTVRKLPRSQRQESLADTVNRRQSPTARDDGVRASLVC